MAYPRELWRNMPLYAQFADDQGIGLLQHICEAIQPHLDLAYNRLDQRDYILDPEVSPAYWLEWLQQLVSLGPQGDRWLGLAINPAWDSDAKRRLIMGAWEYWQKKGTEPGIRWAIEHWLLWEGAADPSRFQIYLPLGDRPTDQPPRWWDYYSSFDTNHTRLILEQKFLGGYEGAVEFQPRWHWERAINWAWEFTQPFPDPAGHFVNIQRSPAAPQMSPGPQMSSNRPYEIFTLRDRDEWPLIAPNIYDLNPEILAAPNQPTPWIWLERSLIPWQLTPAGGGGDGGDGDQVFRYEVDGFKFWDYFPYPPQPAKTIEQTTTSPVLWGNFDWAFGYVDSFGYPEQQVPLVDRQRPIVIPIDDSLAIAWDFATPWYAELPVVDAWETIWDGYPIGQCRDHFDGYTTPFYAPPITLIDAELGDPIVTGDPRPWYWPATDRLGVEIDPGIPETRPALPVRQWYAPWAERQITSTETVQVPAVGCNPGLLSSRTVGTTEIVTPGDPPTPPNQLIVHSPSRTETITHPPIAATAGFDYYEPWAVDRFLPPGVAPLLSPIEVLASPIASLDPIQIDPVNFWWDLRDGVIDPGDRFGYPGALARTETVTIPESWTWESPILVWHHEARWSDHLPFYYPGDPGTPDRVETVSIKEPIRLCNVVDDWTKFEIERYWYEARPPADRPPLNEQFPELSTIRDRSSWRLSLFTNRGSIEIPSTAAVWENATGDRAIDYDPDRGFTQFVVEFTLRPPEALAAHAVSIRSGDRVLDYHNLPRADLREAGMVGFRYRQAIQQG